MVVPGEPGWGRKVQIIKPFDYLLGYFSSDMVSKCGHFDIVNVLIEHMHFMAVLAYVIQLGFTCQCIEI